jgi:hypothetical protein
MGWGTEYVWLVALCGGIELIANILYMLGGTAGFGKLTRRAGAAFAATLGANIPAIVLGVWVWQYLLFFPVLFAGMSMGYGADDVLTKVIRRTVFALGVVSACLIGAWISEFSFLSIVVCGLAVFTGAGSIVLGVLNPFNNAPVEQFVISQLLLLYIPWWAFVK